MAKADAAAPASAPAKAKATAKLFVLDTTATLASGPRTHEMIVDGAVKPFTFEPSKPLPLDPAVALKFLKHAAFQLTDENGAPKEYRRRPKQPDELEAGEALILADEQTVAN